MFLVFSLRVLQPTMTRWAPSLLAGVSTETYLLCALSIPQLMLSHACPLPVSLPHAPPLVSLFTSLPHTLWGCLARAVNCRQWSQRLGK